MMISKTISMLAITFMFLAGNVLSADTRKAVPKGGEESLKSRALETGAALLQSKKPVEALEVYLDGFHFKNGHMGEQIEAHHFCSQLNEDFIQCVLYDGNGEGALLMGIEYVISEKLFKSLPDEEKKMWHSHVYEVKSGMLAAPGLPQAAENELMEKIISTYGKTWHTWNMESMGKGLPLGVPELMMGFTADGQIDPVLTARRDELLGISTEGKKRARADIPAPAVQPGADAWEKGKAVQVELKPVKPDRK